MRAAIRGVALRRYKSRPPFLRPSLNEAKEAKCCPRRAKDGRAELEGRRTERGARTRRQSVSQSVSQSVLSAAILSSYNSRMSRTG